MEPKNAQGPAEDRAMHDRECGNRANPTVTASQKNSSDPHSSTSFPEPLITELSDYYNFRRHSYQASLDDSLDTLATNAVALAFRAGVWCGQDITKEHQAAIRGLADGVADRLNDRCMAYETVLRTTPVAETPELQRRSKPSPPKKRQPKRRAVRNA
jgi:hypothetical protein